MGQDCEAHLHGTCSTRYDASLSSDVFFVSPVCNWPFHRPLCADCDAFVAAAQAFFLVTFGEDSIAKTLGKSVSHVAGLTRSEPYKAAGVRVLTHQTDTLLCTH